MSEHSTNASMEHIAQVIASLPLDTQTKLFYIIQGAVLVSPQKNEPLIEAEQVQPAHRAAGA